MNQFNEVKRSKDAKDVVSKRGTNVGKVDDWNIVPKGAMSVASKANKDSNNDDPLKTKRNRMKRTPKEDMLGDHTPKKSKKGSKGN